MEDDAAHMLAVASARLAEARRKLAEQNRIDARLIAESRAAMSRSVALLARFPRASRFTLPYYPAKPDSQRLSAVEGGGGTGCGEDLKVGSQASFARGTARHDAN